VYPASLQLSHGVTAVETGALLAGVRRLQAKLQLSHGVTTVETAPDITSGKRRS